MLKEKAAIFVALMGAVALAMVDKAQYPHIVHWPVAGSQALPIDSLVVLEKRVFQPHPARFFQSVLPALRLRGGVDPNIGDMAGDISYQSEGGSGIDPYNYDGRLPDSFPNNPESLEHEDESPDVVIDAEEQQRLAKEGTPGPDNLEARDEYNDNEVLPPTDLLQLLSTSRPSGINVRDRRTKTRDADGFDVRGPTYHMAQTGREFLDDFTATLDGLTAQGVMDEIRRDEAKQARKGKDGAASSGQDVANLAPAAAKDSRELPADEDGEESDFMMHAASRDTLLHEEAFRPSVYSPGFAESDHDNFGSFQEGMHVTAAGLEPGPGGNCGLVPGVRVKFENQQGGVCYGVIRAAEEVQYGQEGEEGARAGSPGVGDDDVLVECIDATSCTEMRRVPRAMLERVPTAYLASSSASSKAAGRSSLSRQAGGRQRGDTVAEGARRRGTDASTQDARFSPQEQAPTACADSPHPAGNATSPVPADTSAGALAAAAAETQGHEGAGRAAKEQAQEEARGVESRYSHGEASPPLRAGDLSTHPLLNPGEDEDDDEDEQSEESMFEEAGEGEKPEAWESSDPLATLDDNILNGETMDTMLGHGNGENIEDPELEGVGGQQIYPQTAY